MYSKVLSINKDLQEPTLITIEAGLSGGIPQIQLLGDVSGRYIRNSRKFYFIFSQSGRKLPNKKVRILITDPSRRTTEEGLDLGVITATYLAINDLSPQKDIYCIGNILLDGSITAPSDIYQRLYNIERYLQNRPAMILIPDIVLPEKYPLNNINIVRTVRDIYSHFEGTENQYKPKSISPDRSSRKIPFEWEIAFLLNRSIIHIAGDSPISHNIFEKYSTSPSLLPQIFGSRTTNIVPIKGKQSLSDLKNLPDDHKKRECYFLFDRTNLITNPEVVLKCMKNTKWILETATCPCGAGNLADKTCSCSSSEFHKYNSLLKKVVEKSNPIIINYQRTNELAEERDLDIEWIKANLKAIRMQSNLRDQIISLCPSIKKERANEIARSLTTL